MRLKTLVICLLGLYTFVSVRTATAGSSNDECTLPPDLNAYISQKYPAAHVATLADLEIDDSGFFQKDHSGDCPGLVKVDFYGDGKPTLALILIIKSGAKDDSELFVAHQVGNIWRMTELGTGNPSPYSPAVWSQPPGEYQDVYGNKSIRATNPVIVFCKYEAWAIVYAWTGKDVKKVWISD
jgi:hypothetical protein